MAQTEGRPHVVIFPYPVLSHVNPMMSLAMKLLSYDFSVTFITTNFVDVRASLCYSSNNPLSLKNLQFRHLRFDPPPFDGCSSILDMMITACGAVDRMHSPFQELMQDIVAHSQPAFSPVSCIIGDVYCPWIRQVADSFNIARVGFWTTPVHIDLLYLYQPLLIAENLVPFLNHPEDCTIQCVPGVIPHRTSRTHSYFAADNELFHWVLNREVERTKEALWNLGNNFCELEGAALRTLQNEIGSFLPIGPLLPSPFLGGDSGESDLATHQWSEEHLSCQTWLESQKPSSVIYVAFGSVLASPGRQLEELALGVEASGQPFLWAMKDPKSPIFRDFEERTRDRGLVVNWAPQLSVLSHPSVTGFVTHCGWNSIIESLCAGVPMLALPAGHADQSLNAMYVADEWKVGLELRSERADGLVTRDVVENGVRVLISKVDDECFMNRIAEVGRLARGATLPGGSSHSNLETFVRDMRIRARLQA